MYLMPDATDDEVSKAVKDETARSVFAMDVMSSYQSKVARRMLRDVENRDRDIQEIGNTIELLNNMFVDMEGVVAEQQDVLDNIEQAVESTHENMVTANQEIKRATWYRIKTRKNITDLPEACEACKAALLALVRDESAITVPLALHQRLGGRTGSLWRRIRNEFDVQVDAVRVDKAPAYRIDEANDSDESTVYRDTSSNLSGLSADWVLRGETSKLALVAELINRETINSESAVEARLRIEPRLHRHIIGKQGATIAGIRDATGCEVTVPKCGSSS
ncbi:hypothetical protein LPJ76_005410 [Coemansia sp. RSA 638]|nr:hypothetical protein LPJ76_005410 [Coemansia sp. RSA 638]